MKSKKRPSRSKSRPVKQKGPMPDVPANLETTGQSTSASTSEPAPTFTLNAHYILFILMFVVFAGCFSMIRPYIHTILLAIILSILTSPINLRIEKAVGNRKNLAAFITCMLLTIVVVIPLSFVLIALIQQGISSFNAIYDWIAQGKYKILMDHPTIVYAITWAEKTLPDVQRIFPSIDIKNMQLDQVVMKTTAGFGKQLLNQSGHLVQNLGSLIGKFFLMIVVFFFVVRDETELMDRFLHLFPLSNTQEERIMTKIKEVSKSALVGTLATSLAQGVAGGLAFAVCGFPGLFWGTMMVFASLIPMVGTALIWIPAFILLLITGKFITATVFLIWFIVVVGAIDNVVRPLFMQGGAQMSTLLIFLSILGGLSRFGLMGLLYGPLLFGLALVLIYIYQLEFKDFLSGQDHL